VIEPELSSRERGFAVAAVRALGARAELVCGRRSAALKKHAALLSRDPALLAREAARADGNPAGLEAVHRSWFEPPPPSERPEAAAWLARRAYGHLVEMRAPESATALDRLEQLGPEPLAEILVALGSRRVATAFSGAPRAALARLCARLGEPAAGELVAEVRALGARLSSDEVRAAQRAVFQLGGQLAGAIGADGNAGSGAETARALFLRAGASWLGPALKARGGDRLRRLAQRLPRPIGELLEDGASAPATESEQAQARAVVAALLLAYEPPRAV
jgi:hypothetical protein